MTTDKKPEFGSPEWALSLLPENRHRPLRELHPDPHDYEPAGPQDHGPMATDPDCRICGQPKHWHK